MWVLAVCARFAAEPQKIACALNQHYTRAADHPRLPSTSNSLSSAHADVAFLMTSEPKSKNSFQRKYILKSSLMLNQEEY